MGPVILGSPCQTNQAPLAQIGVEKPFLVRRVAVVSQKSSAPVVFYSRDRLPYGQPGFVDLAKNQTVGAGACDGHHEMSDSRPAGEPAHSGAESVEPV